MKIIDIYSPFIGDFEGRKKKGLADVLGSNKRLEALRNMALEWGEDLENIERWMASPEYRSHKAIAERFVSQAPVVLAKVEKHFSQKLVGELRLSPSLMRFDGFARYELGSHSVWFGVDFPDADGDYLHALLAHELSHVYRDHQPKVWEHLKKPLNKVTRQEYLDNMTASEHLVSEGLATLNSQIVYPQIPLHVHHYYLESEMQWCLEHFPEIDKALKLCLKGDQDVWSFYEDDRVAPGSPSRTQYFWAARVLSEWLPKKTGLKDLGQAVILAHGMAAEEFDCFAV